MASIANDPNGRRRILFVDSNGDRKTIRLGKVSGRAAEGFKYRVEQLLEATLLRRPMEADLTQWLADLDARMLKKLAAVGLISKPGSRAAATLGAFIVEYVKGRVDVKPATKEVWRQGETGLIEFFKSEKRLSEVTPGDADNYKLHLVGKKLASMTVRKRLQFAKMIFRAATRRKLIASDPFTETTVKTSMPDRGRFVTPSDTNKLLAACPNYHWQTIVALARYGGLRCPSEVLSLRWQDIDWEVGRIVVQSPKTEHHPGKATRTIPLFPELRRPLETSFEQAAEGMIYVVDERMRASAQGNAGWRNCNLRTQFERIIKRAGLTAWPRLFHNLRSSRQTELAERFPSHVVCGWLGNSEDIARKHYYQTTDDHFAQATGEPRSGAESGAQVAQNRAQHIHAANGGKSHESSQAPNESIGCAIRSDHKPIAAKVQGGWGGIRYIPSFLVF